MKEIYEKWKRMLREENNHTFKNELDNEITIQVDKVKDTGINSAGNKVSFDAVKIVMEGPTSTSENTITLAEAKELSIVLADFLESYS